MSAPLEQLPRAATGIVGLDYVLGGGLARNRLHLLEGSPGTGKTTIALQFLLAGAKSGEAGIYVSLAETEGELRDGARSHGWQIGDNVEIFELVPPESVLDPDLHQSLLYSSDLELGETITRIFQAIERLKPKRVVIDSLSEIRLLAQSSLRYRRQILALKHYFAQNNSTVVMLDDLTTESTDRAVHSIAHSVIHLDQLAPIYGGERRRLRIVKCRGQCFAAVTTTSSSRRGGIGVFTRLGAAEHRQCFTGELVAAASRRSTPARRRYCGRIEHAGHRPGRYRQIASGPAVTSRRRSRVANGPRCSCSTRNSGFCSPAPQSSGIDLQAMRDAGKLLVEQMDAAELSPGEFSHRVRACIDREGIRTVAIDSLNGYHAAMPEEQFLMLHLHELLQYLNRRGAATFLTMAQHGMVGGEMKQTVDVTYIADSVIMLRLFRGAGPGAARDFGHQKTHRHARGYDPRIPYRRPRDNGRRTAEGIPGRAARLAYLCRPVGPAHGAGVTSGNRGDERGLIFAPRGRDAVIAKDLLRDARIHADVCVDFAELIEEMNQGADVTVVTEEALRGVDTRPLGQADLADQSGGRSAGRVSRNLRLRHRFGHAP